MNIGLLGLGTIGSGVYEHLAARDDIRVRRILELVRHPGLEHLETSDFSEILNDAQIDTVVELIGGMEPAHTFTVQALRAGKNVVSANKLMFSHHMEEILTLAREMGVQYRYDASVGGSIPFLHNLMRHGSADELTGISGIVNGTTNLILDVMQTTGESFDAVLKQAQAQGYAEANPASDIDGIDAQCKLAIAATVAYNRYLPPQDIATEGIRNITGEDIICFKRLGRVCRLIARSDLLPDGTVTASVAPTLVPQSAMEAAIHLNNNAISVTGRYFGEHTFIGQGAGKDPTAFAVELGLRDILEGVPPRFDRIPEGNARVDNGAAMCAWYLRTSAEVPAEVLSEGEALGGCAGGKAWRTGSVSVAAMFALAAKLRAQDPQLFFAALRD